MFVYRTHGVLVATLGALALGACDDPNENTELRPEGPPDVLSVLVMADASAHLVETATYCRPNDEKRPSLVGLPDFTTQQVCDADLSKGATEVTNAYPDGWYVRIMFDELLDPNVEVLTEILDDEGQGTDTFTGSIASTKPVKLECESASGGGMVAVEYDGYYSPSGNRITWPLGPSLVVKPNDPTLIATNTACQITINENVKDKHGEAVPADQRGPFKFSVAPIQVVLIDPPDDEDGEAPINARQIYFDNVYIQFNTFVDIDSLCPDVDDNDLCDDESAFSFQDLAHPTEGPGYCDTTFATCSTIADCDAGMGDTVCGRGFCNDGTSPFATTCNTAADCASGEWCETTYAYSLAPFGLTEAEFGFGPIDPVEVDKSYAFTFTPGAKIKDRCGVETTITPDAADQTLVRFKTNPFDFLSANIASGETATALKKLQLNFTNVVAHGDTPRLALPADALDPTMWTLTPALKKADGTAQTNAETQRVSTDASGAIAFYGHEDMNTEYTFTLKAGAKVTDFYGVEYTNAEDLVITWKTQPAVAITSSTPANEGTFTKAAPTSSVVITLSFNQTMQPGSLNQSESAAQCANNTDDDGDSLVNDGCPAAGAPTPAAETGAACADMVDSDGDLAVNDGCPTKSSKFVVTDAMGNDVTAGFTAVAAGSSHCSTAGTRTACTIAIVKVLPPGTYKFVLKKDATVKDVFGNDYTQAADRVINFTVEEAEAVEPIQCL